MPLNVSGLDMNILCYALDPAFPEHERTILMLRRLTGKLLAIKHHESMLRWIYDVLGKRRATS
ncbi:MAG: hypothetical protein ACYC7D_04190 [Nitrososphaerales archaeon]